MQATRFISYMQDPGLLTRESVAELQQLVKDFPYFQPGHLLLSLAARQWDDSVYQQSLKKTAIVVSNRTHLFQLIQDLEKKMARGNIQATVPVQEITVEETKIPETKPTENAVTSETAQQELNILKAAELSSDQAEEKAREEEKPVVSPEENLEKEIGKQVVTSFVEKELLKTPELHHPKKEEPESFVDWLNALKKNNGQSYEQIHEQVSNELAKHQGQKNKEDTNTEQKETDKQNRKEKNRSIIDNIIEKNPGAIRAKENQKFYAAEIKAKESLLESEHLVTETLARIYALQGSVNKAIRAYEILSLKYPQKSAYFANLIQKLKNNQ